MHVLAPALRLRRERSAPRRGERIEPSRPILLRRLPLALDPALLFEALQGRVERALSDAQQVLGLLLDELAQRPAVHCATGECPEDQQIEGAAEEIGVFAGHGSCCRVSTLTLQPYCRKSTIA